MAGKRKSMSLQQTSHVGDEFFFFYIQLNWYLFIPHFLWKNSINGADSNEQGCTNPWCPLGRATNNRTVTSCSFSAITTNFSP